MLQQILKDMYIDPDVLNALNEDQKKTLFLKMRQEQVRRWKEREEKLELEERCAESKRPKPRKANSKSVNWLLGRDGDVAVIVIGEVDELTSKFICSGMGEKKTPNLQSSAYHQTILKTRKGVEPTRAEREAPLSKAQPGISLDLKGKCEETAALRSLSVSLSEQSLPAAGERKPELQSPSASEEKSGLEPSSCSRPPTRISPVTVRAASANVAPGCVNTRSGLTNPRLATAMASPSPNNTVKTDCESASPTKGSLNPQEPHKSLGSQGRKDTAASLEVQRAVSEEAVKSGSDPAVAGRGRVAQLMKTFSCDGPTQTPSRGVKPPLPTKPGHLRVTATPTVR